MGKELSDMTLEELWELFPIFLVEHDDAWHQQYKEMEVRLSELLSACSVERISHIGSTAIDGIWAKNIVDVLVELPGQSDLENAAKRLERSGFTMMSDEGERISLNLGYTKDGFAEKVYHVHLRLIGDNDELCVIASRATACRSGCTTCLSTRPRAEATGRRETSVLVGVVTSQKTSLGDVPTAER